MAVKKYDKSLALRFYAEMCRVRAFEEKASELFTKGVMSGNIHTCIGQEAIAVGAVLATEKNDFVGTSHRGHGQCLMRGATAKKMMCELFGKKEGYCGGKGGSMHIANLELGILGANGIVGAGIPMSVGSALASKLKKDNAVTLCFFGDAATNTGEFHEGLNLSSSMNLANVFFCENNKYGVSVNIDKVCKVKDLSIRAISYGMEGITIDGNDVFEIYDTVKSALKKARDGGGPTLIEAKTFRQRGHFEGDPQVYKTKEEIDAWNKKDPLLKITKIIIDNNFASQNELDNMYSEAKKEMDAAGDYAENIAVYPDKEEAFTDIYSMNNEECILR